EQSVTEFLHSLEDKNKCKDSFDLLKIMQEVSGKEPKMWGNSIIGFGTYHYKYESGREGDYFISGFSPRKQNLVLYIMAGFERFPELMAKLGKFKTGKSCLYIKNLADIEPEVLKELLVQSEQYMKVNYETR